MNGQPVLDDSTRRSVNGALQGLNQAIHLVSKKEACGDDCQKQKEQITGLVDKLQKYMDNFGRPA